MMTWLFPTCNTTHSNVPLLTLSPKNLSQFLFNPFFFFLASIRIPQDLSLIIWNLGDHSSFFFFRILRDFTSFFFRSTAVDFVFRWRSKTSRRVAVVEPSLLRRLKKTLDITGWNLMSIVRFYNDFKNLITKKLLFLISRINFGSISIVFLLGTLIRVFLTIFGFDQIGFWG